jgi:uncharacterized protein (TIRG00374 family)
MAKHEAGINLKKTLILVLIVFLVVVLTWYLLARENLIEMINALSRTNYLLVGLAIFVYLFGTVIWSTRWRIGVLAVGRNASRRSLFLAVLGSGFINNIHPFTYSGGDPFARTYFLNKLTKTPFSSGFAVIAGEIILDIPVFLSLLAFGLLLSFGRVETLPALFLLVVWLVVLTVMVPLAPRFLHGRIAADKLSGFLWRVARLFRIKTTKTKVSSDVGMFYSGAYRIIHKKKCALSMVALGCIFWTFIMVRLLLIFLALGYSPQIQMLMLAATVPAIVGLVPVLPAGLGTVDAAFYFIYISFGFGPATAISAILIDRMITLVLGTLIGVGALSYLGIQTWAKK